MVAYGVSTRDRLGSVLAVAAIHAGLGWLLLTGLAPVLVRDARDALKTFDIRAPRRPPQPPEPPPPRQTVEPEGAPAAPGPDIKPLPQAAPLARIPVPQARPVVGAVSSGPALVASAGAGGTAGSGAGGAGDGAGSGSGIAVRARQTGGRFSRSDYPVEARRAGVEGRSVARFTVEPSGRAARCAIVRSSGNAALDGATCRVIERRYRFRPARDAAGRAVPEVKVWEQIWWIERDGEPFAR